jgi:hypothetical protein
MRKMLTAKGPGQAGRATWVACAALVSAWLLWYPLRHASAYLDDFVFIALANHIENPLALLFGDALGSFFFRPVVMFSWWASVAVLGIGAPAQLAFSMAVHGANGLLAYVLARRFTISHYPAAVAALLFIVHPAAFSTVAWLADRFDLFATLFGLGALIAVDRYLEQPRAGSLAAALFTLTAALLSKEVAFAFVPVAMLMVLWAKAEPRRPEGSARIVMLAGLAACALLALGLRALALRGVTQTMFLRDGLMATLWGGMAKWAANLPAFAGVRHGSLAAMAAQWPLLAILPIAALARRFRAELATRPVARCIVIGVALMGASAATESPIVHASPIGPYELGRFNFGALAACRFYYLSLVGLALVIAAAGEAIVRARVLRGRAAGVALALSAVAWAGMLAESRTIGREWTAFIEGQDAPLVRAAVAALKTQSDVRPGCKIYLLGTPPAADSFRSLVDTAIKQALPPHDPLMSCFIQTEHTPWYHLVETRALPVNAHEPLQILLFAGKPYPPLRVSNLAYFYLNAGEARAMIDDPHATFYAYDGIRFVDVTRAVRSGARPVRFYDNRPPF